MFAKAFINKPTADAYDDADDVGDPIIDVCTTVETWLDKLNDTAKCAAAMKMGSRPKRPVRANGNASAVKAMR